MTTYQLTSKRSNMNALSATLAGKIVLAVLALTLVMGLLMANIGKAFAGPMPKMDVIVADQNVKLGDVFDGLQQNADFVLAPAPQPGQELVWNEPTLLRIATAFDLPWRPAQGQEIRIRRDAALVDSATLKAVIRDHLAADDSGDAYNVALTSDLPQIVIPASEAPQITLSDFNMQPAGGTFSAIVKVSTGAGQPQLVNLRGVAERMVRVPVLKSGLQNGQIVGEDNIVWTTRKASTIKQDIVRDASLLVGSTPRRTLSAGEPVRGDAIQMPRMIARGDLVTMVFSNNGMMLTAQGRALEDGMLNQSIKVSNTGSNRTIEGRVTAAKQITVN